MPLLAAMLAQKRLAAKEGHSTRPEQLMPPAHGRDYIVLRAVPCASASSACWTPSGAFKVAVWQKLSPFFEQQAMHDTH